MADDIPILADEIATLLETQMRIKGRSLEHQIKKSGRRLPRRIKRDAIRVAGAAKVAQNPKLARMVDTVAISAAAENVVTHLQSIDPYEVMKDRILIALAKVAGLIIVLFVGLVWFAHSRGMV